MSKTINNLAIQALIFFILTIIISLILWPLLDQLLCAFLTHSDFHYSFNNHILEPLIFSTIFTLVFYVPPIFKSRKSPKKK